MNKNKRRSYKKYRSTVIVDTEFTDSMLGVWKANKGLARTVIYNNIFCNCYNLFNVDSRCEFTRSDD